MKKRQEFRQQRRIGRDHSLLRVAETAVQVADQRARLFGDQRARRHIVGLKRHFPIGVIDARAGHGQIERGRTAALDVAQMRNDPGEIFDVVHPAPEPDAAEAGHAGRLIERRTACGMDRLVIQPRSAAALRRKQQPERRSVNHARRRAAAFAIRDRNREIRMMFDEGLRTVDRVDHPGVFRMHSASAGLLAENAVPRKPFPDAADDQFFDRDIRRRNHILRRRLGVNVVRTDAVEVLHRRAARLTRNRLDEIKHRFSHVPRKAATLPPSPRLRMILFGGPALRCSVRLRRTHAFEKGIVNISMVLTYHLLLPAPGRGPPSSQHGFILLPTA